MLLNRTGGGATSKVFLDGEKIKELEMTSYQGANPYTIGKEGMNFNPNTLIKAGLQVINGVSDKGLNVWKKYGAATQFTVTNPQISYTCTNSDSTLATVTVTSGNIDLDKINDEFFDRFAIVTSRTIGFVYENGQLYYGTIDGDHSNKCHYDNKTHTITFSKAANTSASLIYSGTKTWTYREFEGFIVSDNINAYPTDGERDGYWYERFDSSTLISENIREGVDIWGVIGAMSEGVSGVEMGEVTLTAMNTSGITVNHSLGEKPDLILLRGLDVQLYFGTGSVSYPTYLMVGTVTELYSNKWVGTRITQLNGPSLDANSIKNFMTWDENTITFTPNESGFNPGSYQWIAVVR